MILMNAVGDETKVDEMRRDEIGLVLPLHNEAHGKIIRRQNHVNIQLVRKCVSITNSTQLMTEFELQNEPVLDLVVNGGHHVNGNDLLNLSNQNIHRYDLGNVIKVFAK